MGKTSVAPVAAGKPAGEIAGLAGGKADSAKKPFGGNAGRKTRADGLKPGSPAALAADRLADAERKRKEREARRLVTPPPALPAATPPAVDSVAATAEAAAGFVAGGEVDPVLAWSPDDFRQCAGELVDLAEAWRIDCHAKRAAEGKLPGAVVKEIAAGAAFPPGSKKSLATSSPVTLAKMFNALKVPLAVKPVITTAPALAYIIVRDLQTSARIESLIAEHKAHTEGQKATPA
jgi:hypothetical protein